LKCSHHKGYEANNHQKHLYYDHSNAFMWQDFRHEVIKEKVQLKRVDGWETYISDAHNNSYKT